MFLTLFFVRIGIANIVTETIGPTETICFEYTVSLP